MTQVGGRSAQLLVVKMANITRYVLRKLLTWLCLCWIPLHRSAANDVVGSFEWLLITLLKPFHLDCNPLKLIDISSSTRSNKFTAMIRTAVSSVLHSKGPGAMPLTRTFHSTHVTCKTVTEKVAETADTVHPFFYRAEPPIY